MSHTDPIADYLTRIKNALKAKHRFVDIPASKMKQAISQILLEKKFIAGYKFIEDNRQGKIRILLRYQNGKPVISGLRRISKPGLRVYKGAKELPRVLGGLGIVIVSTSRGIMTDVQARKLNVGGEVIVYIW